jgi:hypothetical protein
MYPITIVDNFYKDPYKIREFALSQNFYQKGSWPGMRTEQFVKMHPEFFLEFAKKTLSIFFNLDQEQVYWNFNSTFQLCGKEFEEGWIHADWDGKAANGPKFAGVIYLTPDAPLSGGTSTYILKNNETFDYYNMDWSQRDSFYNDCLSVKIENYRRERELHNNKFLKTIDINNVFNRLVLYNTTDFHKENILFGEKINDSRLTQVFFAHLDCENHPLDRMLKKSKI